MKKIYMFFILIFSFYFAVGQNFNPQNLPYASYREGDELFLKSGKILETATKAAVAYDSNCQIDALLLAADGNSYVADVQTYLMNTGMFNLVDTEIYTTPTLETLRNYDAILVWADGSLNDTVGDTLAAYIDEGGGVVSAVFNLFTGWGIEGTRFNTDYLLLDLGTYASGATTTLGTVYDANHPIMDGVTSLVNPNEYRSNNATMTAGSEVIAEWSDGLPLVVVKENLGPANARRTDINIFPPSSSIRGDFWDASTDGDILLANALVWVSQKCDAGCSDIIVETEPETCGATVTYSIPNQQEMPIWQVDESGYTSGDVFPVGVTPQEYVMGWVGEYTDTCSFTVTVNDTEAPNAVCQDITVELDENGEAVITAADVDGGSNDNCGIDTMWLEPGVFDCSMIGENEVVLTVVDESGNTSTCTATVTVEDSLAPVVECSGAGMGKAAYVSSTVGKPWGSSSNEQAMDLVFGAGNWDQLYYETVDLNALLSNQYDFIFMEGSDYLANEMEVFVDANISDMESWVYNGGNLFLNAAPNEGDGMNWGFGGVELNYQNLIDNVDATDSLHTIFLGPYTPVTDVYSGNRYAHAIVPEELYLNVLMHEIGNPDRHVLSSIMWGAGKVFFGGMTTTNWHSPQPEAFNLRANMLHYLGSGQSGDPLVFGLDVNGQLALTPADIDGGSSDNCGIESMELDRTEFGCADLGEQEVTLTVTDVNGNTAECTTVITIVDDMAPDVTANPMTVYLRENGEYVLNNNDIKAIAEGTMDNCTSLEGVELDVFPKSFECVHANDTVNVRVTAVDASGNSASRWTQVVVLDTIAPVMLCQDIEVELDENGRAWIFPGWVNQGNDRASVPEWARTYNHLEGGSYDACGIEFMELSQYEFTCADLGENLVTLTAIDPSGNVSTCEVTVTVTDNNMPWVECTNAELTLDENGTATLTPDMVVADFGDLCGVDTVLIEPMVFDCTSLGENEVTVTVIDESGNEAVCVASVTVTDDEAPVIEQVEDIEVTVMPGICMTTIDSYPEIVASDNCSTNLMIDEGFGVSGLFPLGTTVETWKAEDSSGNKATMSFSITVSTYNGAPTIDALDDLVMILDSGSVEIPLTGITYGDDCEELEQQVTEVSAEVSDKSVLTASVTYTAGEETGVLSLNPLASGEAEITVSVKDNGGTENGGTDVAEITFKVEIVENKAITGVADLNNRFDVTLYPNPSRDMVYLDVNSTIYSAVDVSVFTVAGKQVLHKNFSDMDNISFNMSDHVSGIYFVKLKVDGEQVVKKLVLDRK